MKVIEFPKQEDGTENLKEFLEELIQVVEQHGFTKIAAVLMDDDEVGGLAVNVSEIEAMGMLTHAIKSI